MGSDISRYLKCNAKFCYYYEELIERQETLSTNEHISVIVYLWWISTDTDLLSSDDCVHHSHAEKLKSKF